MVPANLKVGQHSTLRNVLPKQHFTKPSARYTESSLVKELESLGIGRPRYLPAKDIDQMRRGDVSFRHAELVFAPLPGVKEERHSPRQNVVILWALIVSVQGVLLAYPMVQTIELPEHVSIVAIKWKSEAVIVNEQA